MLRHRSPLQFGPFSRSRVGAGTPLRAIGVWYPGWNWYPPRGCDAYEAHCRPIIWRDYRWSVLGAGRNQLPIAALSVAAGGNIRVGLEDSLWIGPGELATSNAAQVHRARQIIES